MLRSNVYLNLKFRLIVESVQLTSASGLRRNNIKTLDVVTWSVTSIFHSSD